MREVLSCTPLFKFLQTNEMNGVATPERTIQEQFLKWSCRSISISMISDRVKAMTDPDISGGCVSNPLCVYFYTAIFISV